MTGNTSFTAEKRFLQWKTAFYRQIFCENACFPRAWIAQIQ